MAMSLKELAQMKHKLETELVDITKKYQNEIHAIETEMAQMESNRTADQDMPQGPWNAEHEGVVHKSDVSDVHLYERETVFENVHE